MDASREKIVVAPENAKRACEHRPKMTPRKLKKKGRTRRSTAHDEKGLAQHGKEALLMTSKKGKKLSRTPTQFGQEPGGRVLRSEKLETDDLKKEGIRKTNLNSALLRDGGSRGKGLASSSSKKEKGGRLLGFGHGTCNQCARGTECLIEEKE